MPEVVRVSSITTDQDLVAAIEAFFKKGRYAEITQAIGMHAVFFEAEHAREGENRFYRAVLQMIKDRLTESLGRKYSSWYTDFPKLLDGIAAEGRIVTDKIAAAMLSSRCAAGPFKSVDDFFFWALDDRKLTLDQIIAYIEKTLAAYTS